MSDKSRLCNICGHWVFSVEDLVLLRNEMGVAHLKCAWETKDEEEN